MLDPAYSVLQSLQQRVLAVWWDGEVGPAWLTKPGSQLPQMLKMEHLVIHSSRGLVIKDFTHIILVPVSSLPHLLSTNSAATGLLRNAPDKVSMPSGPLTAALPAHRQVLRRSIHKYCLQERW